VSCPTTNSCFAVGSGFLEHWNGKRWLRQRARGVGTSRGVSCSPSDRCTAVGGNIYRWNGKRWRLQAGPFGYDYLDTVWCTSRRSCIAGGEYASDSDEVSAQAAQWTGADWSFNQNIYMPPGYDGADSSLTSLYCTSKSACLALGWADGTQQAFVSTWDGTSWSSTAP
jgi:hypothetical protein